MTVEPERLKLMIQVAGLENELAAERRRSDRWQQLAGHYDEIRYALRNAPDEPSGHTAFYNFVADLIFPES